MGTWTIQAGLVGTGALSIRRKGQVVSDDGHSMTPSDVPVGRSECWCCGMVGPAESMVRLGNHPEVGLCLQCAHFVHKQAWGIEDRAKTGLTARARDGFRTLRGGVIDRGWHRHPLFGGPLRWLGRHLP